MTYPGINLPILGESRQRESASKAKPRISFYTLGCRQNQYDTERIREDFELSGWQTVNESDLPKCIIVNTCSVTNSAERQARNLLNRLLREHPTSKIVMTGCYARNNPHIDPKINVIKTRRDLASEFGLQCNSHITKFSNHTKAFVSIQDGCDRFCSYCIIPYLRGRPISRPIEDIKKEIRALCENGYRVFILTGINIGRYKSNGVDLSSLIKQILLIDGVELIGISSIEPETVTDSLIEFIGEEERFYRWLHISLQSCSNRILKLMNRDYTVRDEIKMIKTIKDKIKDVCIGTDIICGFPGEGEKEFYQTRTVLEDLPISYFHVFRFSPRKGTRANEIPDRPRGDTAKERSRIIRGLGKRKFYEFRKNFLGKDMRVLVENRRLQERLVGVTDNYIKVLFEGPDELTTKFAKVEIIEVEPERTIGKLKE